MILLEICLHICELVNVIYNTKDLAVLRVYTDSNKFWTMDFRSFALLIYFTFHYNCLKDPWEVDYCINLLMQTHLSIFEVGLV